jgi:hypothetical protein
MMKALCVPGFLLLTFVTLISTSSSFTPSKQSLISQPRRFFASTNEPPTEDDDISLEAFQARKRQQEEAEQQEVEEEFDGYDMRDVILEKWGLCYDVDFNRVDHFGFPQLYLNIFPFHLGGRRFRHETELDYLCHLQAVVDILLKYDQVSCVFIENW